MTRNQLIQLAYDRSALLTVAHPSYVAELAGYTLGFLRNDLGLSGDITTNFINGESATKTRTAVIKAKEAGILAGLEEALWLYQAVGIQAKSLKQDGDLLKPGDEIVMLTSDAGKLLSVERCGLNLLQRMSGIASNVGRITSEFKALKTSSILAGSRKTVLFTDNKAVSIGGGYTHRLGLWESIMVKDNHLTELKLQGFDDPIKEAIHRAWNHKEKSVFIVIEVLSLDEACHAARLFKSLKKDKAEKTPCVVMLDHMIPEEIVKTITELKSKDLYDYVLLEASGNIDNHNVYDYAASQPDIISMGSITHSAQAFDFTQFIVR